MFEFWAMDHQLPPEGNWRTWVIMGGRGAGKTRAGAEWVRTQVEGAKAADPGKCKRLALVGETFDQARDVMVFGDSGILACSPPDRRPKWVATRRMLEWPNGATAQVFSARDYEGLRGPQFDGAWVDELAKWPTAEKAWDMLQFGLRLGDTPQQIVTTTPRSVPILRDILDSPNTVVTHAKTESNRANLAASFLEDVRRRYGGTRLARQELDGVLLDAVEGALWKADYFRPSSGAGDYDTIFIAVDPPATHKVTSDLCGISVVGISQKGDPKDWTATVLADRSFKANTPGDWALRVVEAYHSYNATAVVAEVNQGGDMVTSILRAVDPLVPLQAVHASKSKAARAAPIALLYEQGKITHAPGLGDLEDQLCQITHHGFMGSGSPDRADALVWALTVGLLNPMRRAMRPSVRAL